MNKFSKVLVATTMAASILMAGTATSKVSAEDLASNYLEVKDITETYLNVADILSVLGSEYSNIVSIKENNVLGSSYGYYLTIDFNTLVSKYSPSDFSQTKPLDKLLAGIIKNADSYKSVVGSNGLLTISATTEIDGKEYVNTSFLVGENDILDYNTEPSSNAIKFYESKVSSKYSDIKNNDWFKDHVYNLTDLGIVNGSNGKYKPGDNVKRGQFSAMLGRTIPNVALIGSGTSFKDTASNQFKTEIQKLNEMGVIKGYTDNTFKPGNEIKRQHAATMIIRYLTSIGVDLSDVKTTTNFKDLNNVDAEQKEAIGILYNLGVISGNTATTFNPGGTLTRGQMAKILDNTINLVVDIDTKDVKSLNETTNFKSCSDLNVYYPEGVPSTHKAYNSKLDKDEDKFACEVE